MAEDLRPGHHSMKVHLVFSPASRSKKYEALAENMWPPLGILHLASYLRQRMPSVKLEVTDGCQLGYERAIAAIEGSQSEVVGISFFSTTAEGAFRLARDIKRRTPSTIVVLGGPHASALPSQSLKNSGADLVLIGEGEQSFAEVVQGVDKNGGRGSWRVWESIPGACYYTEEPQRSLCRNPPPQFIESLDDLPPPAWDLVDLRNYRGWYLSKQKPEAPILSARGCPYRCTFCSNAIWKSSRPAWRSRSPARLVDDIECLHHEYGVKEVFDQADEFNTSLDHALAICRELKRRNLRITWKAQLRAKPFTEELAQSMAEAGCWYVHLGIESGNQETLDGIGKHITLQEVETTCRMLQKYRIRVLGLFMLYNVWERNGELRFENTAKTENTLRYAQRLVRQGLLNYIGWSVATPYPGSTLFDIAVRHELIPSSLLRNWESWQTDELFMMKLPGVGRREQGVLKRKGELLRLKCLLKNRDFRFADLLFLVKRGFHILVGTRPHAKFPVTKAIL